MNAYPDTPGAKRRLRRWLWSRRWRDEGAEALGADEFDILFDISPPGDLIRAHRARLGLSQRSLARRAGTTQAAVSRIERGLTSPTWETLRSLLFAMGFEPDVHVSRLRGRWDPVHLAASWERSPAERLQLAISANRLAGRMRQAGGKARAGR